MPMRPDSPPLFSTTSANGRRLSMRLPLIVAAISCSFVHADEARTLAARPGFKSKEMGLRIDVRGDGWGSANRKSIETLLYSVADELLSRLPANLAVPIAVSHTDRSPVVLHAVSYTHLTLPTSDLV